MKRFLTALPLVVLLLSSTLARAQDEASDVDATPQTASPTKPEKKKAAAKEKQSPSMQRADIQSFAKLTGVSLGALQLVPQLMTIYALTPEQEEALKAAEAQSIGEAAETSRTTDQKQSREMMKKARTELKTQKDTILSDRQHALKGIIKQAMSEVKGAKSLEDRRAAFLSALTPLLTPEEAAQLAASAQ